MLEDAPAGAAAAHAAGMRCFAVPYVPETASDPAFGTAELLFGDGQSAFTADAAYHAAARLTGARRAFAAPRRARRGTAASAGPGERAVGAPVLRRTDILIMSFAAPPRTPPETEDHGVNGGAGHNAR